MQKKQKVESQESKYDKAQSGLLNLLEQVISNLDSEVERRLDQDKVQNIKKYYFEEYRHFVEFKYLVFALIASIFLFQINQGENSFFGDDAYMFLGVLSMGVLLIRYLYDDGKSTRIYIQKLLGRFDSEDYDPQEIVNYLEKKIFMQNTIINYKAYIVLAVLTAISMVIGFYFNKPILMGAIVVLSFICLFDMPFVKIKKYRRKKREKKEKREENANR